MGFPKEWITPLIKQTWVAATVLIHMMGSGMSVGITSSMLPALLAPDSPIKVDLEQASWISATLGVGCIVMYIISIYIMAIYGRRMVVLIGLIPAMLGPLICCCIANVKAIIFGRFLCGLSVGMGLLLAVVIGEYTSPEYRGVFLNIKPAAVYIGCMIVHALNHYFHWKTVMLCTIVPHVICFAMTYTWPESPFWLALKQKYDDCTSSFYWLRGNSEKSTQELKTLLAVLKERECNMDITYLKSVILFLKKFKKKSFLKPLGIYFFATILLEFGGKHVFPANALQIVHAVDPDHSHAFYYTIGIDMLMSVSAIISSVLVKMMKRRTLLFSSGISSVFILLTICLYYYLKSITLVPEEYDKIALFLFAVYFVVVNLGCIPICLALAGEIFPLEHRPTGSAISGVLKSLVMMVLLKITPIMLPTIKIYGTFTVFGVTMAVCLVILYFVLPETKDKTLQDIETYFTSKYKIRNDVTNGEVAEFTHGYKIHSAPV